MIIIREGINPINPANMSGTEKEVYDQKMSASTPYYYDSADELLFELKVRAAIVEAAAALEKSNASFASFSKSRGNDKYWTRTDNGGFRLKQNARPSAAIRDIYANGRAYAFECAMAIVVVLYKAVLDTIGTEAFDRLFGNLYLYSWEHDSDLPLITVKSRQPTFAGDVLYYKNPDYDPKTPQWQGENVVKMPGNLLFGHGIGIKNEAGIIRELNYHRKRGSKVSAYLLDQVTYPNFQELMGEARTDYRTHPSVPCLPPGWIGGRIGSRLQIYSS
ncbi:protein-glutamine gamma-glutamyltransferase [Paenibacillus mesophilus]|uniref:protein-glutamine gamma-glutamyltransferase n=1 Tax=Paenibacillus mesophilus TaxID=2582849 RepID=UPI00110E35E2|nr:protein-glutamine gamma-glutamyltransferase [Paenibacillus mesophilus]TMV47591.1 protein-glutamine gamma-glutamyltransferase [Paenibacillus mesophilus]